MTLRAALFDFYGTLAPGRTGDGQARARAAQAAELGVDTATFDAELTATVDERFRGAGGDVEGSLAWVAARLGAHPDADRIAAAARVRRSAERAFGEPRPEAVPVLESLRGRGLSIGVISDCSAELPDYFDDLPIAPLVDARVFSFVEGVRKPDPAMYLACCRALDVRPVECIYVGDGGSDELAGARRLGMRAVHLDVPEEHGGVVYGRHLSWDGERIGSLTELSQLIS